MIVATGSTYRRLDVPGEEDLIGAGVHFCATCDGPFYKGANEVVVIGGGNSALEEGLHLSEFAKKVRVLAHSDLSASPLLQERVRSDPQFVIHTGVDIVELEGERGRFAAVVARDRDTRETAGSRRRPPSCSSASSPTTASWARRSSGTPAGSCVTSATMETTMPACSPPATCVRGRPSSFGSAVGDGIIRCMASG